MGSLETQVVEIHWRPLKTHFVAVWTWRCSLFTSGKRVHLFWWHFFFYSCVLVLNWFINMSFSLLPLFYCFFHFPTFTPENSSGVRKHFTKALRDCICEVFVHTWRWPWRRNPDNENRKKMPSISRQKCVSVIFSRKRQEFLSTKSD